MTASPSRSLQRRLLSSCAIRVVVEEFLDKLDVGENHAATAVACKLEMVHGVALRILLLHQIYVDLPLVSDYLAAREATYGDDHLGRRDRHLRESTERTARTRSLDQQ